MNIKKQFRLNAKEIKYILVTEKKFFIRGHFLNINYISQYASKQYNKFGIGISKKLYKKAISRNTIKRIFYDIIYKKNYILTPINNSYKKIYITFNKDSALDPKNKKFKKKIRKYIENDLKRLFK